MALSFSCRLSVMETITIFIDGGSRRNPGPAAIDVYVVDVNNPFTVGVRAIDQN